MGFVTGFADSSRAGAWAIAFELQIVLAALTSGIAVWSLRSAQPGRAANQQFTVLFLFIWTTVIAIVLAFGRFLTQVFGWTIEVMAWEHFWPVQIFAVANGLVAGILLAISICRVRLTWQVASSVLAMILIGAICFSLIYLARGEWATEIVPAFVAHGAFVAATLLPLRNALLRTRKPTIVHSAPKL
jgi:hypothetical protein